MIKASLREATNSSLIADIVATDRHGQPVLIAEVKRGKAGRDAKRQLRRELAAVKPAAPFGMLVDDEFIRLFRWNGRGLSAELARFGTSEILKEYDPDFGSKRIFEPYMVALVEAWLRDLAYRWKREEPPGLKEMSAAKLVARINGGDTHSEVRVGGGVALS
ncbi:MAG: hypothetical protein ABSD28_19070 [Tepidisphaeraceae bacterium]|jgi:hypothetical protein